MSPFEVALRAALFEQAEQPEAPEDAAFRRVWLDRWATRRGESPARAGQTSDPDGTVVHVITTL